MAYIAELGNNNPFKGNLVIIKNNKDSNYLGTLCVIDLSPDGPITRARIFLSKDDLLDLASEIMELVR